MHGSCSTTDKALSSLTSTTAISLLLVAGPLPSWRESEEADPYPRDEEHHPGLVTRHALSLSCPERPVCADGARLCPVLPHAG